MAESDVTDPDPPSDYDGFDDGDYDSDITEEVIEDDNELMSHACLLSHTSPTADDPKGTKVVASSVISGRMEEANLEILEVCPEITESSDPTFQYLNPVLETPVISSTASFGYISTTNDYIGNNNNSNAVVTVQTPDHCVKESTGRKRSYDDLYAVAEESRKCTRLLTLDIKGWKLHLPLESEDARPRNRSELSRLLNEVTMVIKWISSRKNDKEQLGYLHRLACKLRRYLSPSKANSFIPNCSCKFLSESCSGLVHGPPILLENIRCEFTGRDLPPVIFQTFEMNPPWLRIQAEIIDKIRSRDVQVDGCISVIKRPLTFAHITPQHVPAIQCLLSTYFWSNVDVSTVLQYPEFTCVVLYGNLVVAFGYLSPGAHRNEGYINFLFVRPHWRRCGIGETILYLLRQQCLFWTLTLHVSPNSEALNLYHKFGFKTYCRIKNFYAGYVISSAQSEKDALFMKLESRIPEMF
uniref:Cysteine-rich protein 2-binding protein n=1 Tax=Lygus hesperus TaxID=30085 RepID=A0A0A9Y1X1_LYGHE